MRQFTPCVWQFTPCVWQFTLCVWQFTPSRQVRKHFRWHMGRFPPGDDLFVRLLAQVIRALTPPHSAPC
jgi:hypothetical protein